MIVIDFYFTDNGGWIEYQQNGQNFRQDFYTAQSLNQFIRDNNLPLTYKGCTTCPE